jgi:hypothetical protein
VSVAGLEVWSVVFHNIKSRLELDKLPTHINQTLFYFNKVFDKGLVKSWVSLQLNSLVYKGHDLSHFRVDQQGSNVECNLTQNPSFDSFAPDFPLVLL